MVPPSTTETPIRQLVMTLLEQGHLCPLPLTVQPVYWDFDHALRLYPLPDVVSLPPHMYLQHTYFAHIQVILADDCDEYNWNYEDCAVFNPGSFPRDSGFIVYRPAVHKTEISRIR